jgi:hypothetical protein
MWVGMTRRIDPPTFAVHRDDAAGLVACASKISRANQLDSDVDHRPATPGLVHLELILHAGPTSERAIARPSHTMRESPPRKVDVSLRTPTHICDATLVTEPNPGADRRLHERLDALGPAPRAELRPSAEGPRGRGAEGPKTIPGEREICAQETRFAGGGSSSLRLAHCVRSGARRHVRQHGRGLPERGAGHVACGSLRAPEAGVIYCAAHDDMHRITSGEVPVEDAAKAVVKLAANGKWYVANS